MQEGLMTTRATLSKRTTKEKGHYAPLSLYKADNKKAVRGGKSKCRDLLIFEINMCKMRVSKGSNEYEKF